MKMQLTDHEINPLNLFNLRRVGILPPHFVSINVALKIEAKDIENWIFQNLKNRFYSDTVVDLFAKQGKVHTFGFEDPAELTFFALQLPEINR